MDSGFKEEYMMRKKYLIIYFIIVALGSLFGGWKYVEPPILKVDKLIDE